MAEQTTPTLETSPAPQPPLKKKKNRKKLIKRIVTAVIAIAVVAGGAFLVWKFAFQDAQKSGNVLTDFATRSSITNKVTGNGYARANKSATITLAAAGNVQEIFVTSGQMVNEGDPLFIIHSEAAQTAVDDAKKRVEDLNKEALGRQKNLAVLNEDLAKLNKELGEILADQEKSEVDRYIRAPFAGQLRECTHPTVGNDMTAATKLAVLADDSKLRLSLYFSYAYEGKIAVGQAANVSITSSMTTLLGTVEEVNYVRKISDEGSSLFEAVIVVKNPGALKEKLPATASLTGSDGTTILPYAGGELALYRTADILTKTAGKLLSENLLDYSDLKEGDVIAVLDKEDFTDRIQSKNLQIETKKTEIKTANEAIVAAGVVYKEATDKVTDSEKALADFSAVAPMSGMVVECTLVPGEAVESGRQAVTIADNAVMTIEIKVDERNASYVTAGMPIEFNAWNGGVYQGVVESMSVLGKNENGVTTYPAVVKVDNLDGSLMSGMGLEYSFVAAESLDCIVIPLQCVKTLAGEVTAVWLKADSKPENALELTEDVARDVPAGFYAVPVTLGLADNSNVEITAGLNEMDEIYTSTLPAGQDVSGGMGGGSIMVG